MTVSDHRDCRYENSPPSSCSDHAVRLGGLSLPTRHHVLAVRWYLRFGLSSRDVEALLAERGIEVDHVTIYRWVQRCTPQLAEAARPCRPVQTPVNRRVAVALDELTPAI